MNNYELGIFEKNTFLSKIGKRLISQSKPSQKKYYTKYINQNGEVLIDISFRTRGCQHFIYGGCTMCNYGFGDNISSNEMVSNVKESLAQIDFQQDKPYHLFLSPLGSMLDSWEVPVDAQELIFKEISKLPIQSYYFETEAKFVSLESIGRLRKIIQSLPVTIGIGLESSNQWILKNVINKKLPTSEFQNAIEVSKFYNCQINANIIIGPPFLTESESIKDTINSIKWAFEQGVDHCYLFPLNVKRGTITYWLWQHGYYTPPSLWALVTILLELKDISDKISFAWHKMYHKNDSILENKYVSFPNTCLVCYEKIVTHLDNYLSTRDFMILKNLENFDCDCKLNWTRNIKSQPEITLFKRVKKMYKLLGVEILGEKWWDKFGHFVIQELNMEDLPNIK